MPPKKKQQKKHSPAQKSSNTKKNATNSEKNAKKENVEKVLSAASQQNDTLLAKEDSASAKEIYCNSNRSKKMKLTAAAAASAQIRQESEVQEEDDEEEEEMVETEPPQAAPVLPEPVKETIERFVVLDPFTPPVPSNKHPTPILHTILAKRAARLQKLQQKADSLIVDNVMQKNQMRFILEIQRMNLGHGIRLPSLDDIISHLDSVSAEPNCSSSRSRLSSVDTLSFFDDITCMCGSVSLGSSEGGFGYTEL